MSGASELEGVIRTSLSVRPRGSRHLYSPPMFRLHVDCEFPAAHAISIRGVMEEMHGHHFRVRATIEGPRLDGDGLLCDFHDLEQRLARAIDPFRNRTLNGVPPFDRTSPTAEAIARHLFEAVAPQLPAGVRLVEVSVGEAPGCTATYLGATETPR